MGFCGELYDSCPQVMKCRRSVSWGFFFSSPFVRDVFVGERDILISAGRVFCTGTGLTRFSGARAG